VVKRSERDAENSLVSNAEFKYCRDSNSTPPCDSGPGKETILTKYVLCICIVGVAGGSNFVIFRLRLFGP
jgi:hypothetical protein